MILLHVLCFEKKHYYVNDMVLQRSFYFRPKSGHNTPTSVPNNKYEMNNMQKKII